MKNIVASVGLVALGATGLQVGSVSAQSPTDASKPWSLGATLRGFYDDNVNSVPRGDPNHQDSFGFEVSPNIVFAMSTEQTTASLNYQYTLKYYDKKPFGNSDNYDQDHDFTVLLTHSISPRYNLSVKDSFVIGQEPDFLRAGNTFTVFQRVPGSNIRNYGDITFNAQVTRLFGLEVGYNNSLYDYSDSGGNVISPSLSGTSDRLEHRAHVDAKWELQPQTTALLGYAYGQVNFTGDEPIGLRGNGTAIMSADRDWRSHYVYVGAEHHFRPDFSGSLKGGVTYTDNYNDPFTSETDLYPYVNASLTYAYAPESTVSAGFTQDISATDVVGSSGNGYARNMETSTLFASLNHRIMPKLFGGVIGQFQYGTFKGGSFDSNSEKYYLVGLSLEYRFNPHFSAATGYNYDKLDSEIGRSFDKNRVFLGVTATY